MQRVCVCVCGGRGRTMKRDTGDEIRMKLRYGRSNPWFSIRRVLSLPPSSPSPPTDTLLQFVCPCAGATRTNGVCNLEFRTRRKGFLFFFFSFPSSLPSPLSSRGNSRLVFNIFQNSGQKAVSRRWKFEFAGGGNKIEIRIRETGI